jgi:predicted RNA-binding protein YlxR (DUF448 family)
VAQYDGTGRRLERREQRQPSAEPGSAGRERKAARGVSERTCAGCGRKAPQSELRRFAARAGILVEGRTEPGRGVYTCRRLSCFERAADRRAFSRILKQTVVVDPALSRLYTER